MLGQLRELSGDVPRDSTTNICRRVQPTSRDISHAGASRTSRALRIIALDTITEPCIVVANDLTPSDTAKIGGKPVAGFITKIGGRTSHSAIMARSMGIPAIVGAGDKAGPRSRTAWTLLHRRRGRRAGRAAGRADACERSRRRQAKDDAALARCSRSSRIKPGRDRATAAVSSSRATSARRRTLSASWSMGGEGVGLFRSEFLFMDRPDLPERGGAVRGVQEGGRDHGAASPVIIRTLDIGGDKEVPTASGLEKEQNPFLGYRAIRICFDRSRSCSSMQLRALLRAAQYGDLRIMFPMISSVDEMRKCKAGARARRSDMLTAEGVAYNPERQGRHHGRDPGGGVSARTCLARGGGLLLASARTT